VFGKKSKPRERFYLLPGQGGRNFRKKQTKILAWSVAAAVVFGAVLAFFIVWFGRPLH
jgi:high-affinity Fe2+/Pb2+ permease